MKRFLSVFAGGMLVFAQAQATPVSCTTRAIFIPSYGRVEAQVVMDFSVVKTRKVLPTLINFNASVLYSQYAKLSEAKSLEVKRKVFKTDSIDANEKYSPTRMSGSIQYKGIPQDDELSSSNPSSSAASSSSSSSSSSSGYDGPNDDFGNFLTLMLPGDSLSRLRQESIFIGHALMQLDDTGARMEDLICTVGSDE